MEDRILATRMGSSVEKFVEFMNSILFTSLFRKVLRVMVSKKLCEVCYSML